MQWKDVPFHPTRATLRQFAALCLVVFGGMALWEGLVRGRNATASVLGFLAIAIGPVGLVRPEWIRWIYVGWMVLAFPIGWTISQVLLAILFYGLFTPIGLVFRLMGRDPLDRARRPGSTSYWTTKPATVDLGRYFKQF